MARKPRDMPHNRQCPWPATPTSDNLHCVAATKRQNQSNVANHESPATNQQTPEYVPTTVHKAKRHLPGMFIVNAQARDPYCLPHRQHQVREGKS
jgi:hypothetical protein